jgi:two-component system cell cycle response regulator
MKVLVAEDDCTSRSMLAAMVARWGYDPLITEDGGAAWSALQQPDPPRLVLLDWNMPVLDGLDVCRRLRALASTDPPYVILLTGRAEKGDIVNGLEAGANDYVAKPYDNEELQARIQVGRRMLELQAHLLAARDALAHQAMRDPLTGIFNRRAILERAAEELSRAARQGGSLTVGLCDVDHFKSVNDSYGHQAGDDVLRGFTALVQAQLCDGDCVGRYGGEEFLVIHPGAAGQCDASIYERVCAMVAGAGMPTRKGAIAITVSIGVAAVSGESTVDTLLAAADEALYQAKADGRNQVAYARFGAATAQFTFQQVRQCSHSL